MRHSIIKRKSMLSLGAGAQTIQMDEYPEAVDIEWSRFCALVVGGDATLIEIGLKMAKSEYLLTSRKVTNVGQSVQTIGPGCSTGGVQTVCPLYGNGSERNPSILRLRGYL